MSNPEPGRRKVFISYSHQDSEWLKRLQVHLRDLERRGLVELWDDTKIRPGAEWRNEIRQALDSAAVAVLLISADFLASDFIAEQELPSLLSAAEKDGVRILPLILSPSLLETTESLSRYQTVNPPSRPLVKLSKGDQEEYLVKLSREVLRIVEERERRAANPVPSTRPLEAAPLDRKASAGEAVPDPRTPATGPKRYDVFLAYSSRDSEAVERIARRLKDVGLTPFFDEWDLVPGEPLQESLEEALDHSRTCAVFLGANEVGPWENEEMRAAMDERARNRSFRLIPVLLPGAEQKAEETLPRFLWRLTWVDFQAGIDDSDAFHLLVTGIRGVAPGTRSPLPPAELPPPAPSPTRGVPPGEVLPIQRNRRRIDAAVPSSAEVGQNIDLVVQVRFPDSPPLGIEDWPLKRKPASLEQGGEVAELLFPVNPATGEVGSSRLKVRVIAPDFDIEGAAEKILDVPPTEHSRKLSFLLSAKKPGNCRINVEIYGETPDCLGTIPIETTVGGSEAAPSVNIANFFFVVTTNPSLVQPSGDRQVSVGGNTSGSVIVTGDGNEIIINKRGDGNGAGKGSTGALAPPPNPPPVSDRPDSTITAAKTTSSRALIGTIVAAVITAIASIPVALFTNWDKIMLHPSPTPVSSPENKTFAGRVVNKSTEGPVRGAKVSMEGEGVPTVIYTDSEGIFSFPLNGVTKEIHLRIEAEGYENFDLRVEPAENQGIQDIRLTPKVERSPSPVSQTHSGEPEGFLQLENVDIGRYSTIWPFRMTIA